MPDVAPLFGCRAFVVCSPRLDRQCCVRGLGFACRLASLYSHTANLISGTELVLLPIASTQPSGQQYLHPYFDPDTDPRSL